MPDAASNPPQFNFSDSGQSTPQPLAPAQPQVAATAQPVQFRFECPRCGRGFTNPETKQCVQCGLRFIDDPDKRSTPLMILGFLLPPVGIVVFLLLRRRQPRRAISAAQGAIWSPLLYLLILPFLANAGFFTPLIRAFQ